MRSTRNTKRTSSQSLRSSKKVCTPVNKSSLRSVTTPSSSTKPGSARKNLPKKATESPGPQTDTRKRRSTRGTPAKEKKADNDDDEVSPAKKSKTESPTKKKQISTKPSKTASRNSPRKNVKTSKSTNAARGRNLCSPAVTKDEVDDAELSDEEHEEESEEEKAPEDEPNLQKSPEDENNLSSSEASQELICPTTNVDKKGRLELEKDKKDSRQSRGRRSIYINSSSDEEDEDEDEYDDSEEDVIFQKEEIALGSDAGEDSSDNEDDLTVNDAPSSGQQALAAKQTTELYQRIIHLEMEMVMMKQKQEREVQLRDEKLTRLSNELKWKNEQLSEMTSLADKNMELESKIKFLLSDSQNYDKEMKQIKEKEEREEKEKQKAEEDKKKKEEGKKKKEAKEEKTESEDKEEEDDLDDEGKSSQKKRRRSGRKKKGEAEEETSKDEIDAYFVDDDSDVEVIQEVKATDKKKEAKVDEIVIDDKKEDKKEDKEQEDEDSPQKGRHNIRKLMTGNKLQEGTKQAAKAEKERVERVKKEHDKHQKVTITDPKTKEPVTKQLILAFKEGTKTPLVEVNQKLIKKLKPHQVEAVEFMWDNIIESMDKIKEKNEGSGCLLAHCMGLGKTLSVITLVHTLLTTRAVGFKRCLVVCPLNTVLNWQYEWEKWLDKKDRLKVYELVSAKNNHERADRLTAWKKSGGIMIMGYQIFRILVSYSGRSKRVKKTLLDNLIEPGPDVVVCDEGHILKNDASAVSKCMNKIRTKRRIVLTGTPLQNNLVEYHCMVNFVKPNLLGSRREFGNRFVNPITNGQHSDSTSRDVKVMKRRAHILHSMLDGCVQRRDYTALVKFLPPKQEYVLSVRLSKLQIELYQKYRELNQLDVNVNSNVNGQPNGGNFKIKGTSLFADYQNLMRIWTHPWVLKLDEIRQDKKPYTEDDDDELESILFTSSDEEEESESAQTTATSEDEEEVRKLDEVMEISSDETDNAAASAQNSTKNGKDKSQAKSQRPKRNGQSDVKESDTKAEKDDAGGKGDKRDGKPEIERNTRSLRDKKTDGKQTKGKATETESDTELTTSARSLRIRKQRDTKETEGKQNKTRSSTSENTEKSEAGDRENGITDPNARKAKLIAGEVIKQWQSSSRGDGQSAELVRKKEDPWWHKYVQEEHKEMLELSGKMILMFEILRMAETFGDKVLVFSQSLLTLDLIEDFLAIKNEEAEKRSKKKASRWVKDEDYCRMDGSTGAQTRNKLTSTFNDMKNKRKRLFLISTRAGGLGINLDSANRVIIFDASWNPSHDIQSIFRVYRFGQEKEVFIYRFLAQGTMEEKIYERQVTKETLSQRVIDEHQIDRHFTASDLQELYQFTPDRLDDPDRPERPTPAVPKDLILAELLSSQKDWIVQYHEHDSLLENRPDEDLSEEERKAAWEDYEREKRGFGGFYRSMQSGSFGGLLDRYQSGQSLMNVVPNPAQVLPSQRLPYIPPKGPGSMPPGFNLQIAQLPRVVQEILKYNPSISSDELSKRLQTFLGMHTRFNPTSHTMGPGGLMTMNVPLPGLQIPQLQNLVSSLPTVVAGGPGSSVPAPPSAAHLPATSLLMPSRLPLPGNLPANRH